MFGISVTIFANSLYHLVSNNSNSIKTLSAIQAFEHLARQALKMDKKSPINTVSQHTKIYDGAFVYHMSPVKIVRKRNMLLKQLNIRDVHELRKLTSMMLAYSGDY